MPITVVNNNSLVSTLQQTNPITINLPSAVDMSSVALQAAGQAALDAVQTAADVVAAEAAKGAAEAARDAAIAGASGVYDTTANGIAGTVSGDFFVVADTSGWQLYENVSGTATSRSGVFPTLSALGPSIAQAIPWLNVVEDGAGRTRGQLLVRAHH